MRVESKADAADAAPVLHNDPRYCFLPERESVTCASLVPPKKLKIVLKRTNYIFLTRLQSLQTLKTQYFGTQTGVDESQDINLYNAWMYGVLDAGL